MRGKDPDTGETRFDGPPQASQRREDQDLPWFLDDERQPVPAISFKGAYDSPNTSGPEALVHASRGCLGGRPAESGEQAAGLLARIAKLLSPGLTTSETDLESRAKLVQKLDELEVQLRQCGPDGNDSLKAALAALEAELRATRRMPAAVEPPGQKTDLQTGSEGAAKRTPSVAGEMASNQASPSFAEPILGDPEKDVAALAGKLENACDDVDRDFGGEGVDRDGKAGVLGAEARQGISLETPIGDLTGGAPTMRELGEYASSLEQFDRLARKFQRSLTQLDAAKAYRASFEGHGAENPVPETFPAPSMDPDRYDALTRHIEISNRQLAARLEAGLAADAIEMNTLKDLVGDAIKKMELARDHGQVQCAGAALEREIAKLALRLDHAGEGLASLAALERSIGDLSVQLEETRRIVSGLSNAAEPPAGVPKPSNAPGSFEDAQSIMHGIAGLRALHEETAQRAQLALTAIQESVEQVAGHCARLEATAVGMRPDRRGAGVAPEDPFAPILTYLAQHENPLAWEALADDGVQGAGKLQPAAHGDTAGEAGFLIEPGLGFPGRSEHSEPRGAPPKASQVREEGASRTDFIAARRAARMAQMELDGATSKSLAAGCRAKPGVFLFGRSWGLFVTYKRPLVLGAAVMFAAIGAYALARTLAHNNLNDFVPDFLRQSGRAAVHAKPAGVASRTFASTTPGGRLPAKQSRRNEAPGGQLPAAGAANTMAAPLDPSQLTALAEPGFPSDSAAPFGKLSPATRAIAGSDAVVAGTIRPGNMASISAPRRPPVAAAPAKALASAALAAAPTVPSGPLTARAAPPAVGPSKNLLGQAEAGNAAAQFDLAVRYAEGGAGPRNYELAAQWYEKAAQQGLAVAEYRLGSLYEKGLGVGKDMQHAKDLYQRAAEKGNTRAMHNLGVLAAEGGKPNYTSAALWFGKAAEYGIRDSQYNLAVLLARGLGLPKDLVKSYTWFAIVAASGDADAARKRDDVAARLTSSELAAANAAAAGFAPRPADHAANEITAPPAQRDAAPGQPAKPKVSGL
ncbi:MAG: sel1 repeat family protein [Pseudomonadota bacterium]|nr:sel1 repeat family protein [Pseudomonadota bacterium]